MFINLFTAEMPQKLKKIRLYQSQTLCKTIKDSNKNQYNIITNTNLYYYTNY